MDQEYCSTLYNWFEKCGVISNIRTHLRQNLIDVLKNKDVILKNDGPKSAKQYVYDLLIAEYLFNHNYAYTLSVFASEAPLLINFSNMSLQRPNGREKDDNRKLQRDYILHVLETLGINPCDVKGQQIITHYVESDMPLLLCILKCITMFTYNLHNDVPISEKISLCNESTQTEFSWRSYNVHLEKLNELKRKISAHKKMVDNNLHEKEMMLKEQVVLIEQQLKTLNTKLHQVQNVMHSMNSREKQLEEKRQHTEHQILQKEMELTLKERLLSQEANRLQRELDNIKKIDENFKMLHKEKGVQTEFLSEASIQSLQRNIEVQTDILNELPQKEQIDILIKEKEELNALIHDQQLRIEQITQRALQLSRQVEGIRSLRPTNIELPMLNVNANTIISESSSTEDILQDAKLRLKRLEEESLKADQYYYNFINNSP